MSNTFQEEFAKRNNRARAVVIAGYPCKIRRVSLQAFLLAGLVPQDLAGQLLEAQAQQADGLPPQLSDMDAITVGQKLRRFVIEQGMVEPQVTFNPDGEDDKICVLDFEDPDQFITEAYEAIYRQPIQTTEGEVSAAALATFRDNGDRAAEPGSAGLHGPQVWTETVRDHRHIG